MPAVATATTNIQIRYGIHAASAASAAYTLGGNPQHESYLVEVRDDAGVSHFGPYRLDRAISQAEAAQDHDDPNEFLRNMQSTGFSAGLISASRQAGRQASSVRW